MSDPVLYVFVNRDLKSMTNGKALAHSGHAASKAVLDWKDHTLVDQWRGDLNFGTQINLHAPWDELKLFFYGVGQDLMSGIVVDPTYPFIVDSEIAGLLKSVTTPIQMPSGDMLLTRREETAMYFWCLPSDRHLFEKFKLAE